MHAQSWQHNNQAVTKTTKKPTKQATQKPSSHNNSKKIAALFKLKMKSVYIINNIKRVQANTFNTSLHSHKNETSYSHLLKQIDQSTLRIVYFTT